MARTGTVCVEEIRPAIGAAPLVVPDSWDLELRVSPEGGAWSREIRVRLEDHDAVLEAASESHAYRARLPRREIEPLIARLRTAQVPLWSDAPGEGQLTLYELSLGRLATRRIRLRWAGPVPSGWDAAWEVVNALRRHIPFSLPD